MEFRIIRRFSRCIHTRVDAGEKQSHSRRSRAEPQSQLGSDPERATVFGDAVRTLQQILNCLAPAQMLHV